MRSFRSRATSVRFPCRAGGCLLAVLRASVIGVGGQSVPGEGGEEVREMPRDKWSYHLFRPVPRDRMRDLSTDRPDQTESAYTVDSGHFQVETSVVGAVFDWDESGGGDVRTTGWGTSWNVKVGLLNNVDLQFVFDPWRHERVEDRVARTVDENSGFADCLTRFKINLWGNDGGATALAILPFVKWPLAESGLRDGRTEGGLIVPVAVELPGGWGLGAMTEFDFVADEAGGYDTVYFNTVTFGHDLVGNLGGYVEFASRVTPESDGEWQGQVGLGFTYGFSANTQLDLGCNFGVTDAAPDFNPFLGFSLRY